MGGKQETKEIPRAMDEKDMAVLIKYYDKNNDKRLTEDEVAAIIADYIKTPDAMPAEVKAVLKKYDKNNDGKLDVDEMTTLTTEIKLADGQLRWAAYSASFARAFRYLAFTSDVGEALRPIANPRLVTGSYVVALGYCVVDVAYEGYKLQKNNYVHEKGHKMTMAQCLVERSSFQFVASLAGPAIIIHTAVDIAKKATLKLGMFQKWGPSVVGLACIPLLPTYLDEPAEHYIEAGFEKWGPWAKNLNTGHGHSAATKVKAD